jgi:hypothetical protein
MTTPKPELGLPLPPPTGGATQRQSGEDAQSLVNGVIDPVMGAAPTMTTTGPLRQVPPGMLQRDSLQLVG